MANNEFDKSEGEDCSLCKEAELEVGGKTEYGAVIVHKLGGPEDGWFATLSPQTLGNPEKDFSIQLMPMPHVKHMSQINDSEDLAKNYGVAFAKISKAIHDVMKEEGRHNENEENMIRIGTYGKSKHPEEHFHVKLFPWEHSYVVDTTYDNTKTPAMNKTAIDENRFKYLAEKLIGALKG